MDVCFEENRNRTWMLFDADMLNVYENEMRGEITRKMKYYAEANNKYINNFDPSESYSFIRYLNLNNQYWHAF